MIMGLREFLSTFTIVFGLVGFFLWGIPLYYLTWTYGPLAGLGYFSISLTVAYLRHPRRREHQEFDDKLPNQRWLAATERYVREVKNRNVED